ncbi:MAG: hypothetical protein CL912_31270 [Deltaproteobacteria bacterium]|nr:hypothetical protein [Deltaproteobacteria bacterium]
MVLTRQQNSIPHLQSLVIVLLKAVLANVTALITQPMGQQQGLASGFRSDVNLRGNGAQGQNRQQDPANIPLPTTVDPSELPIEEIEAMRSREITAKAVSGILLMLLKWFKVSRMSLAPCAVLYNAKRCRYSQVRVPHPAIARLQLSATCSEAVRSPGNR